MLRKLRSVTCNIEEELKEIINVCKEDEQVCRQGNQIADENNNVESLSNYQLVDFSQAASEGGNSFARMSGSPSVRRALILGVSLQLFQQLAGINTVIYYSARILQMSGISNSVSTILWISCGVNAINFFASFIGEKVNRHQLMDG